MGAWTAPVSPPLMAGTGNWEQSKLEHPGVKPAPQPHLFIFRDCENFSSSSSSLSLRCVCAMLGALHQLGVEELKRSHGFQRTNKTPLSLEISEAVQ